MTMVRKMLSIGVVAVAFLLSSFAPTPAAEPKCAECGMMVDRGSMFYAWLVQDKGTLPFCDIGDLLTYLNKKALSPGPARVKDYPSGDTLEAAKAFFVRDEKAFRTPMGWGIAAFKSKQEAAKFGAVLDYAGAIKAVK
jgi:NosL protein